MKENEKINWGLLMVIFFFVLSLELQMNLDLMGQLQPNVLHKCVSVDPYIISCF